MSSSRLRVLLLASVFTLPAVVAAAASFDVPAGTTSNTAQTLTGNDAGTVGTAATLSTSGVAVTVNGTDTGVTLTNSGTVTSTGNRAVNISGAADSTFTITNNAGASITAGSDVIRLDQNTTSGTITLNNAGLIKNTGGGQQAVDFRGDTKGGATTQINNLAGGMIWSTSEDALRPNNKATVNNAGTIQATTTLAAYGKFDGIDWGDDNTGVVNNLSGGLISGVRHGITATKDVNVTNASGGVIIGNNGSGVGSDGTGVVVNHGRITGAAVDQYPAAQVPDGGDGDGVDIDGIGTITNDGIIEGTGAYGIKAGQANKSEGIALGGGTINNLAGGVIRGAGNGILVDDGNDGPGVAATSITNAGSISSANGAAIKLVGAFNDTLINSGTIAATGGSAVDMGDGADSLVLQAGSTITGLVDGGAGTDSVALQKNGATTAGAFAGSVNFESLDVQSGTWTLTGTQAYANGANLRDGAAIVNNTTLSATNDTALKLADAYTTGVTITNNGTISSSVADGRAINVSGGNNVRNITLNNNAGAVISSQNDAVRINVNPTGGTITVNNAGTIKTTGASVGSTGGQALDFDAAASGGATILINNLAGGQILSVGQDAIRPGQGAVVTNAGLIRSDYNTAVGYDNYDGIDWQAKSGTVVNQATGVISGVRHGITSDTNVNVTNMAGGTITGRNGSGVGSDGNGTVVNFGTITGTADLTLNPLPAGGDGDGVDIDLIANIDNSGTIQGTGARGVDSKGQPNGSEGIAAGGGVIVNRLGGVISGAATGILVDDGALGSGVGATTLTNDGTIRGLAGYGVRLVGNFADAITNSGTITAAGGSALDLGAGNDSLVLKAGSAITGLVDGSAGTDSIALQSNGATTAGAFTGAVNFESLDVVSGSWTLSGTQAYSGGATIRSGATAAINTTLTGPISVATGGKLKGTGTLGAVTVTGTIAPGNSIGTTNVGSIVFAPGATYEVEVDTTTSDKVVATGTAALDGAVAVQPQAGLNYGHVTTYTILTAAGGRTGTFSSVNSNLAFLVPELTYSATDVNLTLRRNDVQFSDVAFTQNQRQAGMAVSQIAFANPLYQALLPLSASASNASLDILSGDVHPSVAYAALENSQDMRGAALSRLAGGEGGAWVKAYTLNGSTDAYGGRANADNDRSGAMIGVDRELGAWRAGLQAGMSSGKLKLTTRGAQADLDSTSFGAYAGGAAGPFMLRIGGGISNYDIDTRRSVVTAGLNQALTASYSADVSQAFAEATTGQGAIQPFAGLAWARVKVDAFSETGGSAAVKGAGQEDEVFYSTLGLRYRGMVGSASVHAEGAWRHGFDTNASSELSFVSAGPTFAIDGVRQDPDVALIKLGGDLHLGSNATLSLDGDAQVSSHTQQYGAALSFNWKF